MAVEKPSWVGTALLVAYLDPDMPGVGFQYLVTAKHVADDVEGKNYVIRANKKDGGVALVLSHEGFDG